MIGRREFLRSIATGACTAFLPRAVAQAGAGTGKPNIILCMADDLGWGDPGFNGNAVIRTPNLDAMAAGGLRFTRFYAAAPVCSPTRGSCLTGRHPYRYGIFFANEGHLRDEEVTLAEVLRDQGYATGHFGKWHLGTLLPDYSGKGAGRNPKENCMTPGRSGFEEWFSTEFAVATWDPYEPANSHGKSHDVRALYWHNGRNVTEKLAGCDSRIIMDRALPFMRQAVAAGRPFFAVIWFHAPHAPVVAGPPYKQMYASYSEGEQHYYGCITALDEQIGRLRAELRRLNAADSTMLWFCSDNGPEGKDGTQGRNRGSAGPFRGRKRDLLEGGIRVPALLEWPARIQGGQVTDVPCCTADYYPTVLDLLGFRAQGQPEPVDGISLRPLLEGTRRDRPAPIAFESGTQVALMDERYKLYSQDRGRSYALYDLVADPGETKDLAAEDPARVAAMKTKLDGWRESCQRSLAGRDYREQQRKEGT
ncbi:MAG: N-acetylgalactosamine 6-sulfate sulfatase [Planctomycetes bacterium]|nr:N-acetylgalactosamine 6-sulfate sulfatase [Planctomycetota bacterium]